MPLSCQSRAWLNAAWILSYWANGDITNKMIQWYESFHGRCCYPEGAGL